MSKNFSKISAIVIAFCSFISLTTSVFAEDEVRKIEVDLKTKGFSQNIWQDNLESNNIIFGPKDQFQIQISVKNSGNRNQTQIQVKEQLPQSVTLVKGPTNAIVNSINQVNWKIDQISPNQEKIETITVAVKDKKFISKDIVKNEMTASVKTEIGTEASDTSYFYTNMGNKEVTVKTSTASAKILPATGSKEIVIGTIIGSSLLALALYLRKYARGF